MYLLRIKSSTNLSHAQWFVSWQFFSPWGIRWQIASVKRKLNAQVSNDIFDMWKWSIFDTCGFSVRINWSICLVAFFVQVLLFLLFSQNGYFWRQSELRWSWIWVSFWHTKTTNSDIAITLKRDDFRYTVRFSSCIS